MTILSREQNSGQESSWCSGKGQEGATRIGIRGEGARRSESSACPVPGRQCREPCGSPLQDTGSSLGKLRFIFFAPLGFDLCEVGQEEVILKSGKQANRRTMHFALQSLLALFGKRPLPPPAVGRGQPPTGAGLHLGTGESG